MEICPMHETKQVYHVVVSTNADDIPMGKYYSIVGTMERQLAWLCVAFMTICHWCQHIEKIGRVADREWGHMNQYWRWGYTHLT